MRTFIAMVIVASLLYGCAEGYNANYASASSCFLLCIALTLLVIANDICQIIELLKQPKSEKPKSEKPKQGEPHDC